MSFQQNLSLFNVDDLQDLVDFVGRFYAEIEQEKLKHRFASPSDTFRLNYYRSVRVLDKVFGEKNVLVHKYDKARFPSGSVVEDFLTKIGCPTNVEKPMNVNSGLTLDAVKMLYGYRNFYPRKESGDRFRLAALGQIRGSPFRFHSSLFKASLLTSMISVERFEKRSGFSLTEDLTAYDDYGIRSERDMHSISADAIEWLRANSNSAIGSDFDMQDIANAVRNLPVPVLAENIR